MKNTMTRIFLMAAALVLAMSLCLANAEEAAPAEEAAVSTSAYIFWQDQDWWPAASNKTDDYWTPTPATVTGEGYYTVKVEAHMPSWFYSGGNSNIGAQKLAVVITDGQTLFPGMYMQIVDVRIDGVSYPCGDVTYGQTGYENAAEDGSLFWGSNDTYALIWDQWMIDNGGTVGTGNTWRSTATAQQFDVFDVSLLNNPSTIEIDFFLSAEQDVKPEGAPALRVIGEGPVVPGDVVALSGLSDLQLDAWMHFADGSWWPSNDSPDNKNGFTMTNDVVTGEGNYTVGVKIDKGWNSGVGAEGLANTYIVIENGEAELPGSFVQITDVRVDGQSVAFNNNLTVPWTWDNTNPLFSQDHTTVPLYVSWMNDTDHNQWNRREWGENATCAVLDPSLINDAGSVEVDFIVTSEAGAQPEVPVLAYDYMWYPDNTMGVAGYSLRDLGIGNKWYNVVPVNMTQNGIYKIPLVASNLYVIGNAIVTVDDETVTVDYETQWASPGNLTIHSECVKWFDEIEDITAEFTEDPQSDLTFGEPMDKAELGNVGYLFIRNGLTYCQPIADNGIYLARYNHNHVIWEAYRAGLDAMVAELDPIVESPSAELVASPDAEIVESPNAEIVPSPTAE